MKEYWTKIDLMIPVGQSDLYLYTLLGSCGRKTIVWSQHWAVGSNRVCRAIRLWWSNHLDWQIQWSFMKNLFPLRNYIWWLNIDSLLVSKTYNPIVLKVLDFLLILYVDDKSGEAPSRETPLKLDKISNWLQKVLRFMAQAQHINLE